MPLHRHASNARAPPGARGASVATWPVATDAVVTTQLLHRETAATDALYHLVPPGAGVVAAVGCPLKTMLRRLPLVPTR
jgi:hypothetical protein